MKTPNQLEQRLKKYFKVDLTDKETQEKLAKAKLLCELKLELLDKVSSFISIPRMVVLKKGCKMGFEKRFLRRELSETLSFEDDLYKAQNRLQRLRDIIYKARKGQNLSLIEYNWLQKELKKV